MPAGAGAERRRTRPGAYAAFFLLFALVLFLSHLPLLWLLYFWDEAGQFVPAALDLLHGGRWISTSATPNIHPPAVIAYLAAAWRIAGCHPVTARCAMLLLAAFGVLAAFLLAIELSRDAEGSPAFLAVGLLCVSPLYFAQAMLAQLDAPAMLFTTLALLFFLQDRLRLAAAASTVLVLVKETGAVVPLVFVLWLARERRWRDALWFLAPAAALAGWIAVLARATGNWAGNPEFVRYNLHDSAQPMRVVAALLRRIYYLGFANLHWVGAAAIVLAWRRSGLFRSRSWRIAWWVAAAHVILFSVLGGAVLERYLLPVLPILYAAMAAALSLYRRAAGTVSTVALLGGLAAANFINPPYPFPYENNLAFADFVRLHAEVAAYLENRYPLAGVHTAWPLTAELSRPELGFVDRGMSVQPLPDLAPRTLAALDWNRVQVLVVFSRTWDPARSALHFAPAARFWQRYYGDGPNVTREQARERIRLQLEAHFERRGQWVDVYVNPAATLEPAGQRAVQRGDRQVFAQHDQLEFPIFGRAARRHRTAGVFGGREHAAAQEFRDELQLVGR